MQWSAVSGADGYNFLCSHYGWYWDTCGWEDSSDTVQYTTVPSSQSQPLAITHYWRKVYTQGKYELGIKRPYTISVRAVKSDDTSAASDWATSETIHPVFPWLRDFSYTRGDGQIAMTWTPNFWTTGYEIHCAVTVSGQVAGLLALRHADRPGRHALPAQRHGLELDR